MSENTDPQQPPESAGADASLTHPMWCSPARCEYGHHQSARFTVPLNRNHSISAVLVQEHKGGETLIELYADDEDVHCQHLDADQATMFRDLLTALMSLSRGASNPLVSAVTR